MSDSTRYDATGCSYNNNGNWATSKQKNPIYVGNNTSGSYSYVGQFIFPKLEDQNKISKIELTLYRTSNSASYSRELYYGCSSNLSDYGSVLSIGEQIIVTSGDGWKTIDISALKNESAPFSGDWSLLLGNPNKNGTYCVLSGHGSGQMPYLTVYLDDGTKVYYATSSDAVSECKVYRAVSSSELVRCDVLYATGENTAIKILGV